MPIQRVTNQYQVGRGIASFGRLYKGQARDPQKPRWTPPELPYFRIEWEPAYRRYSQTFHEIYGKEPKEIPGVLLMGATPQEAFPNWMEQWGAGQKLVRRCDGATICDQFNNETQRTDHNLSLPCLSTPERPCECKQVGRLRFILPDFINTIGAIGSFTLVTHGWYDIGHIHAAITDAYSLYGTLQRVPFTLYREPVTLPVTYTDREGKAARTEKTFQMALLRVQEGYINGALSLPAIGANRMLDVSTGEIRPQLPTGATAAPFAKREDAEAFVAQMQREFEGIGGREIAAALGIEKWGDFIGTVEQAADHVRAHVRGDAIDADYSEMPD